MEQISLLLDLALDAAKFALSIYWGYRFLTEKDAMKGLLYLSLSLAMQPC